MQNFQKQLNFKGRKFHVRKKDNAKIEKQNNISTNIFPYEEDTPYRFIRQSKLLKNVLICYCYQVIKKCPLSFN